MAAILPPTTLADFPPDLLEALAHEAAQDADRVGSFLTTLGIEATPEKPRPLPARFLLFLGAALRLLCWETHGFLFHRAAGLPAAHEALRQAFHSLSDPSSDPPSLCYAVLKLSVERFAWRGGSDLNATVAVEDLTEDDALQALAEYLWATRHDSSAADNS